MIRRAALGRSLGVILPCGSDPRDRDDAIAAAKGADLPYLELDLTEQRKILYHGIASALSSRGMPLSKNPLVWGNLAARLRMTALYGIANHLNYLVVGTDNAAELFTGYFTKYGDGGVDLIPLAHWSKRDVFAAGKYLGVPASVLAKAPSAGLFSGQTDEGEMGVDYDAIDDLLAGKPVPIEKKETIMKLHESSGHKRRLPATPEE